jgi:hypothetical protein
MNVEIDDRERELIIALCLDVPDRSPRRMAATNLRNKLQGPGFAKKIKPQNVQHRGGVDWQRWLATSHRQGHGDAG